MTPPQLHDRLSALPLPIASLLNRAELTAEVKRRHDLALAAWEAAVRLLVAIEPPADRAAVGKTPSLGVWTRALPPRAAAARSPALQALRKLLAGEAGAEPPRPEGVTRGKLLEHLAAYRNRVHGHGAPRSEAFYEQAAATLALGLIEAFESGVLTDRGGRLVVASGVSIATSGRREARLFNLTGPVVSLRSAGAAVPDHVLPDRLYWEREGAFVPLFPWLLWQGQEHKGRVLFFNGRGRKPHFLDFETGDVLPADVLEAGTPDRVDPLLFGSEPHSPPSTEPRPAALLVAWRLARRRLLWGAAAMITLLPLAAATCSHIFWLALDDWPALVQPSQPWGWSDRCWRHLQAGRLRNAQAACRVGLWKAPPRSVVRRGLHHNLGLIAERRGDMEAAIDETLEAIAVERHPEIVGALERMLRRHCGPPPSDDLRPMVVSYGGDDGGDLRSGRKGSAPREATLWRGDCVFAGESAPTDDPVLAGSWYRVAATAEGKPVAGWMHENLLEPKQARTSGPR